MRFEPPHDQPGKQQALFGAPLKPPADGLALFPPELEVGQEFQKSPAASMEVLSLQDFPSEGVTVVRGRETRVAGASRIAAEPPGRRSMAGQTTTVPLPAGRRDAGLPRSGATAWNTGLIFIAASVVTFAALSAVTLMGRLTSDSGRVSAPQQQPAVPLSPGPLAVHAADEPQPEYQPAAPPIDTANTGQAALPAARSPKVLTPSPRQPTDLAQPAVKSGGPLPSADAGPSEQPSPKVTDVSRSPADRTGFQGVLSVETSVPGAHVYINGRPEGLTPVSERQLPAGSHVVRIECEGYERWSAVIRVVAEQTTHVTATLRPIEVK